MIRLFLYPDVAEWLKPADVKKYGLLYRRDSGLDCKSSAYGLEGSNPSTPTNLMNMLIGFLVFITLEIAIIATIGFTYFHEDDKNFKNYRKGKNS